MALKKPPEHILLRLDKDLFRRIDDFRFDNRFESRLEAIRWLLEYALNQNPKPKK